MKTFIIIELSLTYMKEPAWYCLVKQVLMFLPAIKIAHFCQQVSSTKHTTKFELVLSETMTGSRVFVYQKLNVKYNPIRRWYHLNPRRYRYLRNTLSGFLDSVADISGLKVNYEKSESLWIGSIRLQKRRIEINKKILWSFYKVNALGVWVFNHQRILSQRC